MIGLVEIGESPLEMTILFNFIVFLLCNAMYLFLIVSLFSTRYVVSLCQYNGFRVLFVLLLSQLPRFRNAYGWVDAECRHSNNNKRKKRKKRGVSIGGKQNEKNSAK